MLIRPELQALRSNDAPQLRAQQTLHDLLQDWRSTDPGAQAEAELIRFHHGVAIGALPLLDALFCPESEDWRTFLNGLLVPLLRQIAMEPLGQSPLRFSSGDALSTVMLARFGMTTLTLQYVSGAGLQRRAPAGSARFSPVETWERVLTGSAQAELVRLQRKWPDKAQLERKTVQLAAGDACHRNGLAETLILQSAPTSLVQLRLQRRTSTCEPSREYRLDDGSLLHQAAGSPRDSRLELAASLLGRMKRSDAAPMLAAMVEEAGPDSLRWQVLRECLALDTAIGFRTLCAVADRPDDPLRQPATALRAKLVQLHPELNGICPCPV